MRYLIYIVLLLLPVAGFSQTRADYEHTMEQFKSLYNQGNTSGVRDLLTDAFGDHKNSIWPDDEIKDDKSVFGNMVSYTYFGLDTVSNKEERITLFKVVFTKSTHMLGIILDVENKIETIRIKTTSPYIEHLLHQ